MVQSVQYFGQIVDAMIKYCWILVLLISLSVDSWAQSSRRRGGGGFTSSQWYVGISGGVNQFQPQVQESFSEIDYWRGDVLETKDYSASEQPMGYQLGIVTLFSPTNFLQLALNPSYAQQRWGYRTEYTWSDIDNENNSYELDYSHEYTMHYLQLPLALRYVFLPRRWKPFVQAGIQYQMRVDATKELTSSGTDYTSGFPISLETDRQSTNAVNLFNRGQWAAKAGGGIYYNFVGCMAGIELNYYYGFNSIVDDQARFSATRNFQGLGNALDDIRLTGREITFQLVFPMKYLTKSFSPVVM